MTELSTFSGNLHTARHGQTLPGRWWTAVSHCCAAAGRLSRRAMPVSQLKKSMALCIFYRIIYLLYIIYMITILYDYIYTYFIILLCIDVYDVLSHWATKQHHLWHNVTALCLCAVCARCWSMRGQRCTLVIPGLRVTASEVLGGSAGSARAEGFQRKKQSSHRHFEIFWDRVHSEAFLFEDCSEAVKIALSKALVCIGLGLDI